MMKLRICEAESKLFSVSSYMNDPSEKLNKMENLAREVMVLSRNTLLVNLRFLDIALNRLQLTAVKDSSLQTDARRIYYDPLTVLRNYKAEKEVPVRDFLHVVMHCVFCHMFTNPDIDHDLWDLACDIAVENIISELDLKPAAASREKYQSPVIEDLKKELRLITAEKVYSYFSNCERDPARIQELKAIFRADDHINWYPSASSENDDGDEPEDSENRCKSDEIEDHDVPEGSENTGESAGASQKPGNDQQFSEDVESENQLAEEWKEIAEKLQTDLETFSKDQGDKAGALVQNLTAVNRDRIDYKSFLRKFTSLGEVMKINDDEFDYIFYTYGLQLYENMPLVEPLEYKEVKKIKEFVIAIDTSGSTSGELVQRFVNKTYSILKSTETFFSKINIHIIQCDAEIQEHVKITCQEDFDAYMEKMEVKGQGGTDFRPAFETVDRLIASGEFQNLRGMIYFTDGFGIYPVRKPEYETAFVFLDDTYSSPQVPPWAIKLVLQKDEI